MTRIGGITEDLTREDVRQAYIVSVKAADSRKLAGHVRDLGYRARTFESAAAFLDIAAVLAPGCVLVDLRKARDDGLSIPRELRARSIALPAITLGATGADAAAAVTAMKTGAVDYLTVRDDASFCQELGSAMAECHGALRPTTRDENAGAALLD